MSRVVLFFVFIFCSTMVVAQKTYFLYLQSESKQSFFVKHNNAIINSTASGYIIIPDLKDSSYLFNIGIQGKESNKQFLININKKDHGYLIMNDKNNEWTLFDLQKLAIIQPYDQATTMNVADVKIEKVESNPFNDMLAKAVDDSTIKERTIFVKKEEKKPEPSVQQVVAKDTVSNSATIPDLKDPIENKVAINADSVKKEIESWVVKTEGSNENKESSKIDSLKTNSKEEEVNQEVVTGKKEEIPVLIKMEDSVLSKQQKSTIKYRSESSTTEGVGLVFTDTYPNGNTDTIRILIQNEINKLETGNKEKAKEDNFKFLDIVGDSANVNSKNQSVETDISIKKENVKTEKADKSIPAKEVEKKEVISSSLKNTCTVFATETDFFDLRQKMAGENDEDAMIGQARQHFMEKCYTTQHIKNLGSLFLSDLGRFQFYNSSYKYVSDLDNFPSLESELKDQYFIDRFKSILKK